MKIHRFLGDFNLNENQVVLSNPELLNQFKNVLKLKKGELVVLGNGRNEEALAEIIEIQKAKIILQIKNKTKNKGKSMRQINLFCSILKKENFEWVVQKATEVGVDSITPLLTSRTIKQGIRPERLQIIMHEAAEQSDRGTIPKLEPILNFKDLIVAPPKKEEANFLFNRSGRKQILEDLNNNKYKVINLYIGPEGGWSDEELEKAKLVNFKIISLGNLNFRAETAAVIASYLSTQANGL